MRSHMLAAALLLHGVAALGLAVDRPDVAGNAWGRQLESSSGVPTVNVSVVDVPTGEAPTFESPGEGNDATDVKELRTAGMTPETAQTVTIVLVVLGVLCCCVLPLGLLAGYCLCCKKKFEEASVVRRQKDRGEAAATSGV